MVEFGPATVGATVDKGEEPHGHILKSVIVEVRDRHFHLRTVGKNGVTANAAQPGDRQLAVTTTIQMVKLDLGAGKRNSFSRGLGYRDGGQKP